MFTLASCSCVSGAFSVVDSVFCKIKFPACSLKDARVHIHEDHLHKAQENHSDCRSQISGNTCILYDYFGLDRIKPSFFLGYYYNFFLISKAYFIIIYTIIRFLYPSSSAHSYRILM